MSSPDFELYPGKTFSSLCKDIVENTKKKRDDIEGLINDMVSKMNNTQDVMMVAPIIKDCFKVAIDNDDQLTKLAAIAQRMQANEKAALDVDGGFGLTEKEKADLLKEIEIVDKEQKNIDNKINVIDTKIHDIKK